MLDNAVRRLLLALSDPTMLCKLSFVILLIGVFHILMSKREKRNLFPVWATIEIALTSYIISGGSLGRYIRSVCCVRTVYFEASSNI